MAPIITLLTDFGPQDSYVAEVKAVLLSAGKPVTLIDITHQIPAFDVELAAFQLLRAYPFFPEGTIHFAVVDPGVGSLRAAVVAEVGPYVFVGPDNGVLQWAVKDAEKRSRKKAKLGKIPVPASVLPTFHGRDVFAPYVAARLRGKPPKLKPQTQLLGRDFPAPRFEGNGGQGEILAWDWYGNLITSLPLKLDVSEARLGTARLSPVGNYGEISAGRAALIRGSHGFWEIAAREASARELLRVKRGTLLQFSLGKS